MNRRSFFSKLLVATAVAPGTLKAQKPIKKQQLRAPNVTWDNTMCNAIWLDPRNYYGEWRFIK